MLKRLDPDLETDLPLQQDPRFRRALERLGVRAAREHFGTAGSAVVITRRIGPLSARFTSRGPVWADGSSDQEQAAALRQARLTVINAESAAETPVLRQAGYRQIVTAASVAELPLPQNADALWGQSHGKWRNRARAAQRAGVRVEGMPFDPRQHGWLIEAEAQQRRTRRYRTWPVSVTLAYAERHPGDVWLWQARTGDDAPCAAMLFLRHGRRATYHIGWTGEAGRAVSAHHLVLMEAAIALARDGVRVLDLGTVDTEDAAGLARFKIGSGATVRALGGTWLRVPGL